MASGSKQLSIVCLPKQRQAYLLDAVTIEGASVGIAGTTFRDSGTGDWLGFYDWLRASDDAVIGVRQYVDPGPMVDRILLELSRDDVIVDKKARSVEIFFSSGRDYDVLRSSDQDFGDNRLFVGDDGSVLLTFLPRAS
ncbi:hypothetical protein CQ14_15305 [Bradyrhizobium lablabi]|uniref:Uncharacterized protein n=1 Tax=Bradyrhizobium lablabi TaxID=722472 RepID=A0A0R3N3S8_9BRAD|nr:hypothetical protein [Bradyrhizobium lablabi]KRR24102.1 hypothetical protein CQ14_15305 [Bradyrhizobium lablabi]